MSKSKPLTQGEIDTLKQELARDLAMDIDFNLGDMQDPSHGFLKIINNEKYKRLFVEVKE